MKIPCHIGHNDMVYLQCVFTAVITGISFMAHSALIKLLTSVHLNVFMKTTLQRKCLNPLAALIWFLPCVNPQMNSKMIISGKSLVTLA